MIITQTPLRIGLGDMVGIRGDAGTDQPGIPAAPSRGRMLAGFQHQDASTFTEHEAVAVPVERPRRGLRRIPAGGHRPHRREARDRHRMDRRLTATAHDDVRPTSADQVKGQRDRL